MNLETLSIEDLAALRDRVLVALADKVAARQKELWAARINEGRKRLMAVFEFAAGKTNGPFIRFSLKLPLGWLMMVRVLLGL